MISAHDLSLVIKLRLTALGSKVKKKEGHKHKQIINGNAHYGSTMGHIFISSFWLCQLKVFRGLWLQKATQQYRQISVYITEKVINYQWYNFGKCKKPSTRILFFLRLGCYIHRITNRIEYLVHFLRLSLITKFFQDSVHHPPILFYE